MNIVIMCAKCQQLVPVGDCTVVVVSGVVSHAADFVQLCMQRLQRHAICLCRASTCDLGRVSSLYVDNDCAWC